MKKKRVLQPAIGLSRSNFLSRRDAETQRKTKKRCASASLREILKSLSLVMASIFGMLFLVLPAPSTHAQVNHFAINGIAPMSITAAPAITGTVEQVENEPNEPPTAQIFIDPDKVQVFTGNTELTLVGVKTAAAVFQIELRLVFDPLIVAVVDANPNEDGVQIALEPALVEQGVTVVHNQADNESGIIELALLKSWPDTPIDVGYGLGAITWLGLNEGIAEVTTSEARLADENGKPIFYEAQGSTIEVTAVQGQQLSGRVFLQGRLKHNGTNIYATEKSCTTLIENGAITPPDKPTTTTNDAGYFWIENTNSKTYRCLLAVYRGYLVGVQSFPQGNLGTITLPGGDINNDNIVDIFDIAYVGSHYGDNDQLVDINGDGTVSIFDLVIAASNYGKRGPVSW